MLTVHGTAGCATIGLVGCLAHQEEGSRRSSPSRFKPGEFQLADAPFWWLRKSHLGWAMSVCLL